jgi:hypothetical protein
MDSLHGVSPGHLQAYLDKYCYRLNRRKQREDLFRRVLKRCVLSTDPAPSSLLTAAWRTGMGMRGQTPRREDKPLPARALEAELCRLG